MKKASFTLIELLVVVLIIGAVAALAIPQMEGFIIRAKMKELYDTVAAIRKAEEMFCQETGFYASADSPSHPGYDLFPSETQTEIDNFKRILGIEIPGVNSIFMYEVTNRDPPYLKYAGINVYIRESSLLLARIPLEGPNRGRWAIYTRSPWHKYLRPPVDYYYKVIGI